MKEKIKELLESLKKSKIKIAIVGDVMIDEYYQVSAERVSPEFPIPIMHTECFSPHISVPGGAGNVFRQFEHFDLEVNLVSIIDRDFKKLIDSKSIDMCACLPEGNHVPVKKRIYQQEFPLCRWDVEIPNFGLKEKELYAYQKIVYDNLIGKTFDVVIFSDYNKGMFFGSEFNWIGACKEAITIVDPKSKDIEKWFGCSVFKPNEKEAKDLSGKENWIDQCSYFQKTLCSESTVITQGGSGVVGKHDAKTFEYRPKNKQFAESVIGAGDAYAMFLSLALSSGFGIEDAASMAWVAGSYYVKNKHNKSISPIELLKYIDPINGKFITADELSDRKYKLVFTNGCYDVLHVGHLHLLEKAKEKGDKLVVALNTDESIKRIKGESRPINTLEDRKRLIASLEFVDYVISFDEDTPINLIKEIKPDIIVKGGDYNKNEVIGCEVCEVETIPIKQGYSSTSVIENIIQKK